MALKLKLDEALMEDGFFEETSLIGMVCALPPYRLAWVLNDFFDINFVCETDMTISISVKKNDPLFLPVYQYQQPNSANRYLLYKLKTENASLLPEIGHMDYVWLVQTGTHDTDAAGIYNGLRKIQDIILCQVLDRKQMKNLKNLLV